MDRREFIFAALGLSAVPALAQNKTEDVGQLAEGLLKDIFETKEGIGIKNYYKMDGLSDGMVKAIRQSKPDYKSSRTVNVDLDSPDFIASIRTEVYQNQRGENNYSDSQNGIYITDFKPKFKGSLEGLTTLPLAEMRKVLDEIRSAQNKGGSFTDSPVDGQVDTGISNLSGIMAITLRTDISKPRTDPSKPVDPPSYLYTKDRPEILQSDYVACLRQLREFYNGLKTK